MFLLLDEPEVYGLPPDPVVPTRDLPQMCKRAGLAAGGAARRRGRGVRGALVSDPRPSRPPRGASRPSPRPRDPTAAAGGGRRRGRRRDEYQMVPDATFTSYYGRPVVKASPWQADIPAYLFLGGLAGGSSLLAAGADLTGRPGLRRAGALGAAGADGVLRRPGA